MTERILTVYSIKHNSILRDGEVIAEIKSNGLVEFVSPELEKYRLPVWNLLDSVGRITKVEDGQDIAIWYDTVVKENLTTENTEAQQTETQQQTEQRNSELDEIMKEAEVENKLVINTVRELREVIQNMTGEAAPFLSQSLGDKTPELWDYFRRNRDFIETAKAAYQININLDKLDK
jgi:hypothetical protein